MVLCIVQHSLTTGRYLIKCLPTGALTRQVNREHLLSHSKKCSTLRNTQQGWDFFCFESAVFFHFPLTLTQAFGSATFAPEVIGPVCTRTSIRDIILAERCLYFITSFHFSFLSLFFSFSLSLFLCFSVSLTHSLALSLSHSLSLSLSRSLFTWSGQFGSERLIWDHERYYTWKINWFYIRKRKVHVKKSPSLRIYSITTINSILSVVIETCSTKNQMLPILSVFFVASCWSSAVQRLDDPQ